MIVLILISSFLLFSNSVFRQKMYHLNIIFFILQPRFLIKGDYLVTYVFVCSSKNQFQKTTRMYNKNEINNLLKNQNHFQPKSGSFLKNWESCKYSKQRPKNLVQFSMLFYICLILFQCKACKLNDTCSYLYYYICSAIVYYSLSIERF